MIQLRGFGLNDAMPFCSAAAVGQQCIPDGASTPPSNSPFSLPATVSAYTPPTNAPPTQVSPGGSGNPFQIPPPGGISIGPGGISVGQQGQPGTTPGTVATTVMPTIAVAASPWYTQWWGMLLLAGGAFFAYRQYKSSQKAAA